MSDADTLPQSNQASFSLIFAPFSFTSFQSARLNFSHWNNTEKNCTFRLFETSVNGNVTFAYIMTFHFHSVWSKHSTVLNGLSYGMALFWFLCYEMTQPELCEFIILFKYLLLIGLLRL